MALEIRSDTAKSLPSSVTTALGRMPADQQAVFEEEYVRKRRNPVVMLLLAIFFPIQLFIEGRIGLGILFVLTLGGWGIWYIIEILTVWRRTKTHNEDTAKSLLRDMRIMSN